MTRQDGACKTSGLQEEYFKGRNSFEHLQSCGGHLETLVLILSGAPPIPSFYVARHNAALRVFYHHLRHCYGIDSKPQLPYSSPVIECLVE